jgi:multimeric flavodoxin WrbA
MKTFVIKEYDAPIPDGAEAFDLSKTELRHCIGCWACWWTTPGRCVHHDLDDFYRQYLAADKVVVFCDASQGFVSANMKAMLDRMIPLMLPYISWEAGESLHEPRYDKYPDVEIVYRGGFLPGEEDAFVAYWKRTVYMLGAPEFSARRDSDLYARGDGV